MERGLHLKIIIGCALVAGLIATTIGLYFNKGQQSSTVINNSDFLTSVKAREEIKEVLISYDLVDKEGKVTLPVSGSDNEFTKKDIEEVIDNFLKDKKLYIPVAGKDGKDGKAGVSGKDGKNGEPGKDGIDGTPGPKGDQGIPGTSTSGSDISIEDITLSLNGDLLEVTVTDSESNEVTSNTINLNLSGYVTSSTVSTTLTGYVSKTEFSSVLAPYIADFITVSVIDLSAYYTKTETSAAITNAINDLDISKYVTSTQMNTAITNALGSYYTKTEIDSLLEAIEQNISDLETTIEALETNTEDIDGILENIENDINSIAEDIDSINTALASIPSTYATKSELTSLQTNLQGQIDIIDTTLASIPSTYATKSELSTAISGLNTVINGLENKIEDLEAAIENIYTKDEVDGMIAGYVTSSSLTTTLANYVQASVLDDYLDETGIASTYATISSLNTLAGRVSTTESEIINIWQAIGDLDFGSYITTSSLTTTLANYYTKNQMDTMIGIFRNGAMVPDYANMETTNRISTNNGTWTVDRDGFIKWSITTSGSNRFYITINNNVVVQDTNASSEAVTGLLPVKKGDVVKINTLNSFTAAGCYFIPPTYTAPEVAWIPDYANMETTNRITANNGTWTVDRDGFIRVHNTGTSTTAAGYMYSQVYINNQLVEYLVMSPGISGRNDEHTATLPVKKGDVVRITTTVGNMTVNAIRCHFIPPRAVLGPTINMDYSTSEIDTGKKWIDGKTIYRKVFTNTRASVNNVSSADVVIQLGTGIDDIIEVSGFVKDATGNKIPLGARSNSIGGYGYNDYLTLLPTGELQWRHKDNTASGTYEITAIVEYTKK